MGFFFLGHAWLCYVYVAGTTTAAAVLYCTGMRSTRAESLSLMHSPEGTYRSGTYRSREGGESPSYESLEPVHACK